MSDEGRKNPEFDTDAANSNVRSDHGKSNAQGLGEKLPEPATGEHQRGVSLLARVEKLVSLQAEDARLKAARQIEVQDQLVRVVAAVKDLLRTANSITEEIHSGCLTPVGDPKPAACAVILLASILRQVYVLSSTTMGTVEAQNATMRELTEKVGEMAKESTNLTRKVAALAEGTRIVLPPLSKKNLVVAELQCLNSELEKALTDFRGPQTVNKAGIDDVTPQLLAKPQVVN